MCRSDAATSRERFKRRVSGVSGIVSGSLESLSRTSSLARSSSNLVSHLCEAVKRKHLGVVGLVDVATSNVPVTSPRMGSPKQWEGGNFVETVELVPKSVGTLGSPRTGER